MKTMLPPRTDNMRYLAEGTHNVVVQLPEENAVYRFIKRSKFGAGDENTLEEMREKLQSRVDYMSNVIGPCFGTRYVTPPELVSLPGELLQHIHNTVESYRPENRTREKELDIDCHYALRLPDFCRLHKQTEYDNDVPTFSIEIKTKCGFIPSSDYVTRGIKKSICTFCLYQPLKLHNGRRNELSHYCPIDLFSGNKERMKYALKMLIMTPQNNLRIFRDGQTIYSEEIRENFISELSPHFCNSNQESTEESILESFLDLLIECLLYTPTTIERLPGDNITLPTRPQTCARSTFSPSKHPQDPSPPPSPSDHHSLPGGSVLHRVLSIQRLDELDIEGIYPIYKRLNERFLASPELRNSSDIEGPFTSEYLQSTEDSDSKNIKDFMVSKTAKDCSIMIAFKPSSNECDKDIIKSTCGETFQFSVALIDFDPKPLQRIDKYYKEDHNIVEKFKEFMKNNVDDRR